jgi:hypothetical protein
LFVRLAQTGRIGRLSPSTVFISAIFNLQLILVNFKQVFAIEQCITMIIPNRLVTISVAFVLCWLTLNSPVGCDRSKAIVWPMNFEIRAGPRPIPERRRKRVLSIGKRPFERNWIHQDEDILSKLAVSSSSNHVSKVDSSGLMNANSSLPLRKLDGIDRIASNAKQTGVSSKPLHSGRSDKQAVRIKSKVTAKTGDPYNLRVSLNPNGFDVIRCDLSRHSCGLRNDAQLLHKFRRTGISGDGVEGQVTGMVVLGGYSNATDVSSSSSNGTVRTSAWARLSTPFLPSKGRTRACLKLTWLTAGRLLRSMQVIQQDSQLERVWFHQSSSYMNDDMSVAKRFDMMEIRFRQPSARFLFTALLRPSEPGFVALLGYDLFYSSCVSHRAANK